MNPDPLSTNSRPMQYQDALIVATVITILMVSVSFFTTHSYDMLAEDPDRYVYDLVVLVLQTWIASFAGLTGLTVYAKRQEAGDEGRTWS